MEDRRKDERVRCSAKVEVSWRDPEGRSRNANAQLMDVSAGGLSFLVNERIAVNTPVQIHYSNSHFAGQTRYWTCDILGWVVGVQLDQRVEWGPMAVESPGLATFDWPVGRVRSRRRITTIVRDFFSGLGGAPRKPE
jgi:hypothetical protein